MKRKRRPRKIRYTISTNDWMLPAGRSHSGRGPGRGGAPLDLGLGIEIVVPPGSLTGTHSKVDSGSSDQRPLPTGGRVTL
jgi:hypothetical protein